ncbi:hypothetical protein ONZ45_g16010 [Pleurotus djamor]|nr:hypothetical protein ONZ45_g16010 [Pleurotus djamor]
MVNPVNLDYRLYLVTGRDLLPPGKDYYESLEESIQGGVTLVQLREKNTETKEFLEVATKSKAICDKYGVPLIINDRLDIALAVGAAGVHVGQTDMPVDVLRKFLPPGTIVGVSCHNVDDVVAAVKDGVDYIGVGPVWATQTKKVTSPLVGVRGVGAMLDALQDTNVKAVIIGGIKSANLLRTLHGSVSPLGRAVDGIAVVSQIMASPKPAEAATKLTDIFTNFTKHLQSELSSPLQSPTSTDGLEKVCALLEQIKKISPLVHQAFATQSANITLALGASPLMATSVHEMEDLSKLPGALLVNIGTMVDDTRRGMLAAGESVPFTLSITAEHFQGFHANANGKPVVLDPVGVGASQYRKDAVKEFLNAWQATVIKGNAGELAALSGTSEVASKGVDSVGDGFKDPVTFVRNLAKKERCIIALTGKVDYVSDGRSVAILENGHEILGHVTGSGCIVGSCIASFCAASASLSPSSDSKHVLVGKDMLFAAIGGISVINIAAELSMKRGGVHGNGTFLPLLIDSLYSLTPSDIGEHLKVTFV